MTHLEILAGEFDAWGREATWFSAHYMDETDQWLAGYYAGRSSALYQSSGRLRREALERAKVDKEVSE